MQVKGLELAAYDPRGLSAQALAYMTSPTGACHLRGGYAIGLFFSGAASEVLRFAPDKAAAIVKAQQDLGIIQDSLGVCRFTSFAFGAEPWAGLFSAAIGEDVSVAELETAAQRIAALERRFNLKAGFTRKDDDLPARFKTEPIRIGDHDRVVSEEDRERMLDDYYAARGWDREGAPTPATLEELGIE